jgi:hypothetical protein
MLAQSAIVVSTPSGSLRWRMSSGATRELSLNRVPALF